MHSVNNNLPGTRVYKEEETILSGQSQDFNLMAKLPDTIQPNVLIALFFDTDVDLNSESRILDTDINILQGNLIVDLGEFPL